MSPRTVFKLVGIFIVVVLLGLGDVFLRPSVCRGVTRRANELTVGTLLGCMLLACYDPVISVVVAAAMVALLSSCYQRAHRAQAILEKTREQFANDMRQVLENSHLTNEVPSPPPRSLPTTEHIVADVMRRTLRKVVSNPTSMHGYVDPPLDPDEPSFVQSSDSRASVLVPVEVTPTRLRMIQDNVVSNANKNTVIACPTGRKQYSAQGELVV